MGNGEQWTGVGVCPYDGLCGALKDVNLQVKQEKRGPKGQEITMKDTTQNRSYKGKEVFVGLDVHKKSYVIVARVEQQVVKKWTTEASPSGVAQQLLKYFKGANIHTVYEAGFSGFVLHRELKRQGIDSQVVHAAAVEVAAHDRVKTDKRDANKLSLQLEAGRLGGICIPSEAQEQKRLLSRTRQQMVEERAAIKTMIRMKAHQFGLIEADDERQMSHRFVEQVLALSPGPEFTSVVEAYRRVWQSFDQEIRQLDKQLKQQAAADPDEATYRSGPGIGAVSARVLSNELGNLSRFANERQLFSYTGLTPSEHSSGQSIRRGGISKQGNRRVRAILIEVAWRAIEEDPALGEYFNRLYPKRGKKRAIVAVARKLIGRVRAAFRQGGSYQLGYPQLETTSA